ncbi:hypothetical protein EYS42_10345 [Aquabacterium lacunae]|uniref:Uncharacterized protein n=1 Tax=Aquabacterium lacunae TaxID=2528630 RepID=A0A4Q9H3Y6_9BURK|nr:hypothetical protein EYS42_10345 [Aquabacterium lacunae]
MSRVAHALAVPLARLALARGVPCDALRQVIEQAFVEAAQEHLKDSGVLPHRQTSRIAAATGLGRREVDRVLQQQRAGQAPEQRPTWANEVFTRWVSDRSLRNGRGQLKPLPRIGHAPSFESLARSVTLHVHPRSLLDDLCRLGLARHDALRDTVELLQEHFVPQGDEAQLLALLQDNVGAHLTGAVHNVLHGQIPGAVQHHDQSVMGDELSDESIALLRAHVEQAWQQLLESTTNLMTRCMADDREAGRPVRRRIRIGLYSLDDDMPPSAPPAPSTPPPG